MNEQQLEHMRSGQGFIAALDQSGGSTPKALGLYGVTPDAWSSEEEMFDLIHAMRARMMMSPAFDHRVLGAILFEMTMDRSVDGVPTATFLWERKGILPFLKVDQGLADRADGVQILKDIPGLDALRTRAVDAGIFGTKMRSVIAAASASGIGAVVSQQFEIGARIRSFGMVPIIEPEVDITIPDKEAAERILLDAILSELDSVPVESPVMLKLSIPSEDDLYRPLVEHPSVLRVVALSGGYPRTEANERLSRQHGMIASFSRALAEGLSVDMSEAEFDRVLDETVSGIYAASIT
jgi:fructose-bisphosphate aldolase class I